MAVRKAVIPAAGLGTRFLPATKVLPKEMIPVVDKPAIQYAVEEAVAAGMTDILIVTSRSKSAIEDHFDRAPELERRLESSGKVAEAREVRRLAELADIHFIRQSEPRGFGHAIAMARAHVAGEPFGVLVPDEIVPAGAELMQKLVQAYDAKGATVLAVQEVAREDIGAYGVIDPQWEGDDLARVLDMIEKPPPEEAPSTLAARGRYVLSGDVFDALDRTEPGVGGEIQLTDAIKRQAHESAVYAVVYRGRLLDVGKKLDFLKATVELALGRDELREGFRAYLEEALRR